MAWSACSGCYGERDPLRKFLSPLPAEGIFYVCKEFVALILQEEVSVNKTWGNTHREIVFILKLEISTGLSNLEL